MPPNGFTNQLPGLRPMILAANGARRQLIDEALADHSLDDITAVFDGRASEVLMAADATLLASGTAALEALLCQAADGRRLPHLQPDLCHRPRLRHDARRPLPACRMRWPAAIWSPSACRLIARREVAAALLPLLSDRRPRRRT